MSTVNPATRVERPPRSGGVAAASGRDEVLVSVVIPCLNEAEAIAECVRDARQALRSAGLEGEVLVADNGSTDGSRDLARAAGARLVEEPRRGYGRAYQAGFAAARGRYIMMVDGDDSYDFSAIGGFIESLEEGSDLVIGSRFRGTIQPGAMSWLHRYVGNPLLTGVLNVVHRAGVSDAHCGMRAFRRDLLPLLDLRSPGMEFASEQVIRSSRLGLRIREIPIDYRPRRGKSKLSTFVDGWRHLRLVLATSMRAPR
jgi:glycosyltransferase involved in cell wall biosynthesis